MRNVKNRNKNWYSSNEIVYIFFSLKLCDKLFFALENRLGFIFFRFLIARYWWWRFLYIQYVYLEISQRQKIKTTNTSGLQKNTFVSVEFCVIIDHLLLLNTMRMLSVSDQLSPNLGYKLYAKPSGMCSNIYHSN